MFGISRGPDQRPPEVKAAAERIVTASSNDGDVRAINLTRTRLRDHFGEETKKLSCFHSMPAQPNHGRNFSVGGDND